ncbi:MAG: DoxX family protein [Planctomycetes bacterium]|nr:DoxX family protein [Planctomycetota bacterium]
MSNAPSAIGTGRALPPARTAWKVVFALVFLRLCIGWHFFSEGSKKVAYDQEQQTWTLEFSSAGFLSQAKGPLAGFFQSQLPTGHDWQTLLVVPEELTPESSDQLGSWVGSYVKRRKDELKKGKYSLIEVPEYAPHAKWQERIIDDWRILQKRFADVKGLDADQRKQAASVFERRQHQLADYLAQEALDIQAWRHELWRLETTRALPEATIVPFQQERILQKSTELKGTPRKWVGSVNTFDLEFANDLRSLLTEDQKKTSITDRVENALTTSKQKRLTQMDIAITGLIIGVGICLLAGFCTRLAALGGAAFLLSVVATQPPWVPDAITTVFYYQLVEFAALLLLSAVGAGRWAGIDSIIHCLWSKCCGTRAK